MLETIVEEMKANATQHKLDFIHEVPTYEQTTKIVAIDDKLVKLMLTCDLFPTHKLMWHLSMSVDPYGPIPLELAEMVRKAFFGEEKTYEVPSLMHGDRMKQYISLVKEGV